MTLKQIRAMVRERCQGAYSFKSGDLWIVWHDGICIGSSLTSEYGAWNRAREHHKYRGSVALPVC